MGLQAEIWAWRLGEGGTKEEKKKKKEKTPHMCESIGHRPLRGRCPIVAKALDGQRYPCPALVVGCA